MALERGTRQALGLREVAKRLGVSRVTAKRWWSKGRLIGRAVVRVTRRRVVIPIEVVDFYLQHFRLPTKLELFETQALSREFLLGLDGPDGGLGALVDTDEHATDPARQ